MLFLPLLGSHAQLESPSPHPLSLPLVSSLPTDHQILSTWRVLLEPTYMLSPLTWKIPGAKKTVLVPIKETPTGTEHLDRTTFLKLGTTQSEFFNQAAQSASAVLKTLKPQWIRDESGVIIFAILESDNQLAATTVIAPEFTELFKDNIGDDLLIAIPHRDLVYIFSRQDPEYQRRGNEIIDAYKDAIYPVSTEAFILKDGRLQAIGEFSR